MKIFFSDLFFFFYIHFFFGFFVLRCWYHMLSRLSTTIYYTSGFHIKTIYISQPLGHINFLLYRCKCVNLAESSLKNLIWYFSPHSYQTQIRRRHAKISNQTCWRDKDLGQNFPRTFIFKLKPRAHIFSNAQILSYNLVQRKKFIIWTDFSSYFYCFGDFSDWFECILY